MSDQTPAGTQAPRRRSGWWLLLAAFVTLAALSVVVVWYWLRSDGDLRALRERVAAAGLPTTVAELKRQPSTAEDRATWEQLGKLIGFKKLKPSSYTYDNRTGVPRVPLRKEFIDHHAALPAAMVGECEQLIDQLSGKPIVFDPSSVFDQRARVYQLDQYLYERALSVPPEQVTAALDRLLRLGSLADSGSWRRLYERCSPLPGKALLYRRNDLTPAERRRFARALLTLLAEPEHLLQATQRVVLVDLFALMADPGTFEQGIKERGLSIPGLIEFPPTRAVVLRAGRAELLAWHADWASTLQAPGADLRSLRAHAQALPPPGHGGAPWNPTRILDAVTRAYGTPLQMVHLLAERRLNNELIAAVLCEEPWPIDWFDPGGARLRPIIRDGMVVGAYSVGVDGVDDGGVAGRAGKDRRWALFAPLEPLPPLPTP